MLNARMPTAASVLTAVAAVAAGALLLGCSAHVEVGTSAPKLSADKVADTVAQKLAATTGQPKPHVTCPGDLDGKVGTTMRCTLTGSDGRTLGVTVDVTSVSGNNVNFDIKADDKSSPAPN
ncbi:DUF4333 domain-containing protein [Streptomyces xanthochromogenes]|uniref:DUF4333 domain-containing protein n=1 Tax=Streptomyces xanthochromogenes TaxID=67384 RepID=UPI003426759C